MKIKKRQGRDRLLCGVLTFLFIFTASSSSCLAKTPAAPDTYTTGSGEEVKVASRFFELFFGKKEEKKEETLYLCPAGSIFGVKIKTEGVTVSEITSPAASALSVGDVILEIDGERVNSASEVGSKIREAKGALRFCVLRDEEEKYVELTPTGQLGARKLGIVVRDGAAGIGTITYINGKTGEFGGLGHGICDTSTGKLVTMEEGIVTEVTLGGVKRGEEGRPGELRGVLKNRKCGAVTLNCDCGIFGKLDTFDTTGMTAIPIGKRESVHEGAATILSTVTGGGVAEYTAEISNIEKDSTGTKSFSVKITDPTLIAITGGIVRGMSGSPIIQDGKLVGAVTHVMVADPTEGYGIFIENMLNASNARNELPRAA